MFHVTARNEAGESNSATIRESVPLCEYTPTYL